MEWRVLYINNAEDRSIHEKQLLTKYVTMPYSKMRDLKTWRSASDYPWFGMSVHSLYPPSNSYFFYEHEEPTIGILIRW